MEQHLKKVMGYNIWYVVEGKPSNKPLLLLHGIGASSERWFKVMPLLSKRFYVIAPDIIGFGYSEKPDVDYTIPFFVEFVKTFMDSLNLDRVNMIGSSLGGHIAAEFALSEPEALDKLVLVSSAGMAKHATPAMNNYILAAMYPTIDNARTAFQQMAANPDDVDEVYVKNFVNRMLLPNAKYAFLSALMGSKRAANLDQRLHLIKTRTLIVWGEKDPLIPIKYAYEFAKIKDSKLFIMKDVGHIPFVEMAEEFNKVVTDFLNNRDQILY